MPELPEVEVTRLSFADRIKDAQIIFVRMGKPLRWPLGCDAGMLHGRWVRSVRRRGKYLLLDLDEGLILLHLGMSGSLSFSEEASVSAAGVHDHFDLVTTRGILRLHDPRRFGAVVFAAAQTSPVVQKLLGHLGVEPLTDAFELRAFHAGLRTRKAPIKQVLLAGDLVVGVGNIYASEVLFMAGIRPTTSAAKIGIERAGRLHHAIQNVLRRAVIQGGSTLRDFSNAQGQSGYFQLEAMVYGRENEACRTCGSPIQSIRQGQRTTYFCARCQRP